MNTRQKLILTGVVMGVVTALLIWASTWGGSPRPVTPTTLPPFTPITTVVPTTAAPLEGCSHSDGCCHHIHECETGNPAACAWLDEHHCCPDIDCSEEEVGSDPDLHRCLHSCEDTIHCGSARADSCACSYLCREYPNDPSKWNNCHGCEKLAGDDRDGCPADPEGIPYCHSAGDCDSAETSCSWICCPDAPIAKLQGKKCCCPCVPDGNHSCDYKPEEPCPCTIVTPQCCHGDQATNIGELDVTTDGVPHKINCAWCALGIVPNDAEEAWCLSHCKDEEPHK